MLLRFGAQLPCRMFSMRPTSFSGSIKQALLSPRLSKPNNNVLVRQYARGPREPPVTRAEVKSRPSLKERLMAPPSGNAYSVGKGAVVGAAGVGLAAMCYYGLGVTNDDAVHKSYLWPQYVRERIQKTYLYFGASVIATALSAMYVSRMPRLLELTTRYGWMSTFGTFALVLGTGAMTQSIPYNEGIGVKQAAWLLHCLVLGGVVAPLCFLGGPLLTRAALYTGGIVGGLSTVAACAPNEKFLYMGGPLAVGLGLVMASSIAGMWLPPTTALGAGLASISIYGGLILFSGFLLYDTQRIIHNAEMYPRFGVHPYDPVNASLSIYLDVLNIFIRLVFMLGNNSGKRK